MLNLRKKISKANRALVPAYRSLYFTPAIIFAASLAIVLIGWQSANAGLAEDIKSAAEIRLNTAQQTLRERMMAYEQVLRGGAGMFQSSQEVSLDEWRDFVAPLQASDNFAGLQSIGAVSIFDKNQLPQIQRFMTSQGVNDFEVTPEKPNGSYAAILYIEPNRGGEAPYGFDLYSDSTRREAMQRARDSGKIAITRVVEAPLGSLPGEKKVGFTMFAPFYSDGSLAMASASAEDRRQAVEGYVFAAFESKGFFEGIVGRFNNDYEGLRITAGSGDSARTIYESPSFASVADGSFVEHAEGEVRVYGETWTIQYASESSSLVSQAQIGRPMTILFFGVLSAVLISIIVLLLIRSRLRYLYAQQEQALEVAKDELLSLASHQLRTPATGVKQYLGMVLQGFAGDISDPQRKMLEKAYDSNDRQLRIINEILHLAKIGAGRIVLSKQPTNLSELAADIVNEQMPDIKSAEHTVNLRLRKKPLIINADPHMLRMAIENLVSNAIKYTPSGGEIEVSTRKRKSSALISIKDTGVGVKPEDIDKIFQQFSRLPNEMSQQVGGTGIGLYLAKHLVELHGGQITVDSTPGKGSTFTISLPLKGQK